MTAVLDLALLTENVNAAFSSTPRQNQSVLPRCPRDTVNWTAELYFVYRILPITLSITSPNLDLVIVATGRQNRFILRVSPCYLPGGTIMCLKCLVRLLCSIWFDCRDLDEAITVTRSDVCSVVVVLAIVYIFLMLWLECINLIGLCWRLLLPTRHNLRVCCH